MEVIDYIICDGIVLVSDTNTCPVNLKCWCYIVLLFSISLSCHLPPFIP